MDEKKQLTRTANEDKSVELVESESGRKENIDELDELLEAVPEEHRNSIKELMVSSASFQMGGMFPSPNPIAKKITEEHITQYLEGSKVDMENRYAEKKHQKVFLFLSMLLAMVFFIIVIILLKENPDVMEKIIYTAGGLVAGAFGGYGLGKNKSGD